jgi:hypothetical protein
MKRLLLAFSLFITTPGFAGEITSRITDSVQLTVQGAAVQTERIGSSYAVGGTNIGVSALGGLTGGTSSAAATMSAGTYAINNDGQAFSFTESLTVGDSSLYLLRQLLMVQLHHQLCMVRIPHNYQVRKVLLQVRLIPLQVLLQLLVVVQEPLVLVSVVHN